MARHGLGTGALGSLFVLWSVAAFALEIPSGAWADLVDRRMLLVLGPLLRAVGFATWVLWPTYAGFALGFVLWSVNSAVTSGTFEALLYDGLAALGEQGAYLDVVARARLWSHVAMVLATVGAAPLLSFGGYPAVAAVSAGMCVACAVIGGSFPRPRARVAESAGGVAAYLCTLRAGLREAITTTALRRLVLLVSVLEAYLALDEFLPLLGVAGGLTDREVPFLVTSELLAMAAASAMAPRLGRLGPSALAAILAAGGVSLAAGVAVQQPAGFVGVAAFFGAVQLLILVSEARLQHAITGPARATVTSVEGFTAEVLSAAVFGGVGAVSGAVSLPVVAIGFGALGLPVAVLVARWLVGGNR